MSSLAGTLARGIAAGLIGGAVMTAAEKAEQALTGRPDSYVPGRTLAHLVGLSDPDSDRVTRNLAMHFGTAATAGVLRARCRRRTCAGRRPRFCTRGCGSPSTRR